MSNYAEKPSDFDPWDFDVKVDERGEGRTLVAHCVIPVAQSHPVVFKWEDFYYAEYENKFFDCDNFLKAAALAFKRGMEKANGL